MGSKCSPTVSNLFVEEIEKKFVYTYKFQPLLWKRFIDDIFFIWTYLKEELNLFIEHLNSRHPTIKFTTIISKTRVDYLDTTVKVDDDGEVYTTLYTKPTDTHIYLHYRSSHPIHKKQVGPIVNWLESNEFAPNSKIMKKNSEMILNYYKLRGYSNQY